MSLKRQMIIRRFTTLSMLLLAFVLFITVPFLCVEPDIPETTVSGQPTFHYQTTSFSKLVGWEAHSVAEVLPVFLRSCTKIMSRQGEAAANPIEALGKGVTIKRFSGLIADWQEPCLAAAGLAQELATQEEPFDHNSMVRAFFEDWFVPVQIINRYLPADEADDTAPNDRAEGKFTGYFEPVYAASRGRSEIYNTPLYARPDDLVELDLGQFREDLAGNRLAGRVIDGRLYPYDSRADINRGALDGKVDVLAYLDADDAFFLQIQGSGVLQMPDGTIMRVGFAGQNGHPYTAIGKPLVARGEIPLKDISLQSIYDWLKAAAPAEAQALREENSSFVFFQVLENLPVPSLGPLGADGTQLTPERSLAADRRYHAMGTPVWVDIKEAASGEGGQQLVPFRKLMVIQDTGGAIRGPVRGDVFWGRGEKATHNAGQMNASGIMAVLLPKAVVSSWREQG